MSLVATLEKCLDLRHDVVIGLEKAFGGHARFDATTRKIKQCIST